MKILLISPRSDSALTGYLGVTGPPLGLGYLASYIRNRGFRDVRILDALTLGLSNTEVLREIERFEPDIVGVSINSTPSFYDSCELIEKVKEFNENVFMVVGGVHVTFTPHQTMKECPCIDVSVVGEGEETFFELVSKFKNKEGFGELKGIVYRGENGEINEASPRPLIKNLDTIPFPAYDLLPMDKYVVNNKRFGTVITSRGCPFKCIYCSSSRLFGSVWRSRSPENVLEELKLLRKKYRVKEIEFLDDNFTLNPKRAEKIAEKIKEENLEISWTCSSRVDTVTRFPWVLKKLRDAGCHAIYVGIESGSQRILNIINKMTTLKQAIKAVEHIKKAGIDPVASFVIGIPGETKKEIIETIRFAKKLKPAFAQFTIATPFPGTPLYEKAVREKRLLTRDWSKFNVLTPIIKLDGLTPQELSNLLRKAYLSFYASPRFLIKQIRKKNLFLFKKSIDAFINYLRDKLIELLT